MSNPLTPPVSLLTKLGSIAVRVANRMVAADGHDGLVASQEAVVSGPKRVYMVVWIDHDIFEIDSLWYSRPAAEARRDKVNKRRLIADRYEVEEYEVSDGVEVEP